MAHFFVVFCTKHNNTAIQSTAKSRASTQMSNHNEVSRPVASTHTALSMATRIPSDVPRVHVFNFGFILQLLLTS